MTDNISQGSQGSQLLDATAIPVRLVRGDASPEELAALVTILAAASIDGGSDPTDRLPLANGRFTQPPWGSPRGMMRTTPPHGPGCWRKSALPG
jgi:hypothetical protein